MPAKHSTAPLCAPVKRTNAPTQPQNLLDAVNDECVEKPFTNSELESHFSELYHLVNLSLTYLEKLSLSDTESVQYVLANVCGLLDVLQDRASQLAEHESAYRSHQIAQITQNWLMADETGQRLMLLFIKALKSNDANCLEIVKAMIKRYKKLKEEAQS